MDTHRGLKYKQVWTNNMSSKSEPQVSKLAKGKEHKDYTKVSFVPGT